MTDHAIDEHTRRSRGWRVVGWGSAAALLALPAIAMQFTDEVVWGSEDFAIFAIMLLIAGLLIEFGIRLAYTAEARAIVATVVVVGFLLVWAELAVGLFD